MKSENRSAAFLRKRKMMLVLPLLVIPFLTMAFWALGGGSGASAKASGQSKGLNLNLPQTNLRENEDEGKLSFYERAQKDSAKRKEWMESDPYYKNLPDSASEPPSTAQQASIGVAKNLQRYSTPFNTVEQNPEDKLMQKLSALQTQLNKPTKKEQAQVSEMDDSPAAAINRQTQNLRTTPSEMSQPIEEDPEIKQLSTTLDKILDIQHPDRIKERLKEKSVQNKKQVFVVAVYKPDAEISLLKNSKGKESGQPLSAAFFGDKNNGSPNPENAVPALVHGTQIITAGSTVKLRLLTDVYVGGRLVPSGTFVYGVASLEGDRLLIAIPAIRFENNLLPVSLSVYDLDGLAGIRVPGSIPADVARQSVDQGLGNIGLLAMDPSLKAQAASEGIKAAKSLLSRKVKQVNITLTSGYRVLLRDGNADE